MPAMPGAALIVIETEFVLGGLEAVFDSPATAFHRDQFFRGRALGAPGGEERHSTIGNVAADQQPSRPLPGECAIVLRHGPESPAASARIQPVFRGSLPRS